MFPSVKADGLIEAWKLRYSFPNRPRFPSVKADGLIEAFIYNKSCTHISSSVSVGESRRPH